MSEQYRVLHPLKFCRDHFEHGIRPDGRQFTDFREIFMEADTINTADGSAVVTIGSTKVLCGIKCEIATPKKETPMQGYFVINIDVPASNCGSEDPKNYSQVMTNTVKQITNISECIDLNDLCIYPEKMVWCLYADLICLDNDGALIDACILALNLCLRTVTVPEVIYDPESDSHNVNLSKRNYLNINTDLVSTTFVTFDNKITLVDPTTNEEELSTGKLTIVLKNNDECCFMYQAGGWGISEAESESCFEQCKLRGKQVKLLIKKIIDEIKQS